MSNRSIIQIVITATVDVSPAEFVKNYENILLERVDLCLHSLNSGKIIPVVEDFEITGVEEI